MSRDLKIITLSGNAMIDLMIDDKHFSIEGESPDDFGTPIHLFEGQEIRINLDPPVKADVPNSQSSLQQGGEV